MLEYTYRAKVFSPFKLYLFLFIYLKQEQVDPGYDSGLAKTWYISAILDSKKSYKTLWVLVLVLE